MRCANVSVKVRATKVTLLSGRRFEGGWRGRSNATPLEVSRIRYQVGYGEDLVETANLIRTMRLDAGLTQAELAERAATPQSAIAAYESGRRDPSVSTLRRLARIDELLGGPDARSERRREMGKRHEAVPVERAPYPTFQELPRPVEPNDGE